MGIKQSQMVNELVKFCEAAWFDLPLAAARRIAGAEDQSGLSAAGWKAYEAWVSLSNEAANRLYANRTFGEVTGRTIETALRLQRVGDALTSAFFGNLWPALGLPTASQVGALRDEVAALREAATIASSAHKLEPRAEPGTASDKGLHVVHNGSSPEALWAAREAKQRAAA